MVGTLIRYPNQVSQVCPWFIAHIISTYVVILSCSSHIKQQIVWGTLMLSDSYDMTSILDTVLYAPVLSL